MPDTRSARHTGGCQCGAVRYALYADPDGASICHCRMCQKATGGFFGAYAGVTSDHFTWTRGQPSAFRSSQTIERDFCPHCGTPLTFRYLARDRVSIAIATLDDPSRVAPKMQLGIESRLPYFSGLAALPAKATSDWASPEVLAERASYQHPDHETELWPPPGR